MMFLYQAFSSVAGTVDDRLATNMKFASTGLQLIETLPPELVLFHTSFSISCRGIDTWRPRQNDCHFAGDIFKFIFLPENCCILIQISLEFVPKGFNNKSALVQVMVCRLSGNKPLPEPLLTQFIR